MAPAVSVIGRTPARVITSHLETASSWPAGGLTVESAWRQRARAAAVGAHGVAPAVDAVELTGRISHRAGAAR